MTMELWMGIKKEIRKLISKFLLSFCLFNQTNTLTHTITKSDRINRECYRYPGQEKGAPGGGAGRGRGVDAKFFIEFVLPSSFLVLHSP